MENTYTIKQVSEHTALPASAIRYYESEGLISGIRRNHANVRCFSDADVVWIAFLSRLKSMEMPIGMMKKYARLRAQGNSTIAERIDLLNAHKQAMQAKIQHIQDNIGILNDKIALYQKMEVEQNDK